MSLVELPLHAGTPVRSHHRRVTRHRGQHHAIARPQRDAAAIAEDEVDRAARAVEQLRIGVLVLAVAISRAVGPAVDVACLFAHPLLDRGRVGNRPHRAPMFDLHRTNNPSVRVGVVFPHQEIGNDPAHIAAYAQAAEDLGYAHVVAYDHVVGADPAGRPSSWRGVYTHRDAFHEPFVLFGYLAAVTKRIELAFGIVILPQRQTILVAKQAASLDVLSRGRVRLGVAIGWNHVEYEALGMAWRDRAKRIEEQIHVMRLLWTNEVVDYTGRWHRIDRAGINPLPIQRPIPLWMGADEEIAVKRVARLADGWFSHLTPDETGRAGLERFRGYVREAGRDPGRIGVEGRVPATGTPDDWTRRALAFREMGMTHLEFRTGGSRLPNLDAHIDAMRRFREAAPVF